MDLTKIEKPIALLDATTKQALLAHGGPYEMVSRDGVWISCGYMSRPQDFFKGSTYRVKTKLKAFAVVLSGRIIAMTTDKDHAAYCRLCSAGSTIVELEEKMR